jgi:hypothetical protein
MSSKYERIELTFLSIPLSHTLAATATALDRTHNTIHVRRTAPFLVSEDINPELFFASLDQSDVGEHALVLESAGELSCDGSAAVETGEGDQLEDEADLVS